MTESQDDGLPEKKGAVASLSSDVPVVPSISPVREQDKCMGEATQAERYSVFTEAQKRAIIVCGSFLGLVSYMSCSIYYPALNQMSNDLHVPNSKINLTVTVFLLTQGLVPVIIAEFSERFGRRPAYFICFSTSAVANLGLALQNDYYSLLFLRILQAAGSSGTISQSLVGDCITSAERGKYIAYTSVSTVFGPSLSPVLGGLISQFAGWHWIFWFLLILTATTFVPLVLFMPETCRHLVGNGSIPPPWVCCNVSDWIRHKNRLSKGFAVDREKQLDRLPGLRVPRRSPVAIFSIVTHRASALQLLCSSLGMACYYAILTDLSKNFQALYRFSNVQVSLIALGIGGGSIVSAFTTGRLMDWNYRRVAQSLGLPVRKHHQMDLSQFPIERVRLQIGLPVMFCATIGVLGYGWTIRANIPVAIPIIFVFIAGYGIMGTSQVTGVLMADLHPGRFAVAAAARNVYSNSIGAVASAVIDPLSGAVGNGWSYSILALLFTVSLLGPVISMTSGLRWRHKKQENTEV